jgi:hypothetical protein
MTVSRLRRSDRTAKDSPLFTVIPPETMFGLGFDSYDAAGIKLGRQH